MNIKNIVDKHFKRTKNKNQIGSVEKILTDLMPDILEELEEGKRIEGKIDSFHE